MRRDSRNENEKASPKEKVFGGIVAAVFGLIWTIGANRLTADSPFGNTPNLMFTGFGILFIIVALANVVSGINELKNDQDETAREIQADIERQKREEERARAAAEAAAAQALAAARAEKAAVKKMVYCPYCGTAQDDDYKICESCGAGRRK